MDRLEAMSIVLLAAERGSLTAVAKELNMSLPTVSRKVTELEAHLGTKRMQRSTRKLVSLSSRPSALTWNTKTLQP
jgi:DNA-binding transcriptional LysR family regulator